MMNVPVRSGAAAVASVVNNRPQPRSEATQVEQSRAVAEVQAMVTVAQTRHRDITRAIEAMQQSTARMALAERAFFSFRRAGSSINGPSIHLARELARCWGNIDYGLRELDRDDMHGRSEMLAFAWDLETNARAHATFIVPHMRDKTGGPVALVDMRDIYENNANHGARRLREQIFAILPVWYREEAIALSRQTLEKGESDEPLPMRISKMVAAYAGIGISRERIEARFGGGIENMTVVELANFGILFRSIRQGEANKDEEFPPVVAGQVGAILNARTEAPPQGGTAAPAGQAGVSPPAAAATDHDRSGPPAPSSDADPNRWLAHGTGQEAITKDIVTLIGRAKTLDDLDAIDKANGDRIAKFTQANRAAITNAMDDRKEDLGGG